MMVIGFLAAVWMIRRLSKNITPDPQMITNASLYSLVAGVIGARIFFVIHYFSEFRGNLLSVFAIWKGGLELLGGVLAAIAVIFFYLRYYKLPVREYLDILAIGLMLALMFGRIGCILNGCCYGEPSDVPWAIRFPYDSLAYQSQVYPDAKRERSEAQMQLPAEYFMMVEENGHMYRSLVPFEQLTEQQQKEVTQGQYRCMPIHPTQVYSSASACIVFAMLYLFWKRNKKWQIQGGSKKIFIHPGSTFAMMFVLYPIARFLLEYVRDDNPFEHQWWTIYQGGTISQNISIYMFILGWVLMFFFQRLRYTPIVTTGAAGKDKG